MLDSRITDFATLVALVLVLLTLFTGQRAAAVLALREGARTKRRDAITELSLDLVLLAATALLFLIGLPIAVDATESLHPLAHSGPLRGAFVVTWLLLVGLVVWQWRILEDARKLLDKLPKTAALR
jgi:hypothetical protein